MFRWDVYSDEIEGLAEAFLAAHKAALGNLRGGCRIGSLRHPSVNAAAAFRLC